MGIVERKQREWDLRKMKILNAAKEIFLAKGFIGATMEEIADKAEFSTATIYLHFKSKDELYASLNQDVLRALDSLMSKIVEDPGRTAEEKLQLAWDELYKVYESDPTVTRVILHFQLEDSYSLLSTELITALNKIYRSIVNKITTIFQRGIDQGSFRAVNARAMADILLSSFVGLVLWEDSKRRLNPKRDHLKSTLELGYDCIKRSVLNMPSVLV